MRIALLLGLRENQNAREGGEAVGGSCALVFEGGLVQCDTVEMFGFSGKQLSRTFRGYG